MAAAPCADRRYAIIGSRAANSLPAGSRASLVLEDCRPLPDVPGHRWRQFLADCHKFLGSSEHWAERAAALGWDAVVLFGCRSHRPLDHLRSVGLV